MGGRRGRWNRNGRSRFGRQSGRNRSDRKPITGGPLVASRKQGHVRAPTLELRFRGGGGISSVGGTKYILAKTERLG